MRISQIAEQHQTLTRPNDITCQTARCQEGLGPQRSWCFVVHRKCVLNPRASLVSMSPYFPEPPEAPHQAQAHIPAPCRLAPSQGSTEVIVLHLDPIEPHELFRT